MNNAARVDPQEVVPVRLDHDSSLVQFFRALNEAAKYGRAEICPLLLDCGFSCAVQVCDVIIYMYIDFFSIFYDHDFFIWFKIILFLFTLLYFFMAYCVDLNRILVLETCLFT
jgi:hypothetical protein